MFSFSNHSLFIYLFLDRSHANRQSCAICHSQSLTACSRCCICRIRVHSQCAGRGIPSQNPHASMGVTTSISSSTSSFTSTAATKRVPKRSRQANSYRRSSKPTPTVTAKRSEPSSSSSLPDSWLTPSSLSILKHQQTERKKRDYHKVTAITPTTNDYDYDYDYDYENHKEEDDFLMMEEILDERNVEEDDRYTDLVDQSFICPSCSYLQSSMAFSHSH